MNVFEASLKRLDILFKEFDNIYVSFSGGKDSGVLLNLCIFYIRKFAPSRRISVFHMDYEAQYELTTDYVDKELKLNSDIIDVYHCCVPFKVTTCTSMHQQYWRPWQPSKRDIWVRQIPEHCYTELDFSFFNTSLWDYDFQEKFSTWIHDRYNAKKTVALIGNRSQESLNRWRSIHSERNTNKYHDLQWTKEISNNIFNAYPIYDWVTEDIWIANSKFKWSYNKLYDMYYMAGVPLSKQRVASPFISAAQESLKLYRVIEPHTWGRLVLRVNGVNFTGLYGGSIAMGWNSIKLPDGHTWESFMFFLLKTLPTETRENYLNKLHVSIKFWKEKGGVLSHETIDKLRSVGVKFEISESTNYKTSKLPVRMEYLDDIDISEFREIPTYKRMCISILKNDHLCKYMGFSLTKNELVRRKNILEKYKSLL